MRLIFGCMPSRSAPPPPNGSKYSFGLGGNTCQIYGISFSLLPIQGINGLAIPATPVRGFGEGSHCLLQAADRRIQTSAHFLELPDGRIQLCGIAGVKISFAAANEMLAPKAEAFQIVAQFFIIHVCPFRADFPEKGAKKASFP